MCGCMSPSGRGGEGGSDSARRLRWTSGGDGGDGEGVVAEVMGDDNEDESASKEPFVSSGEYIEARRSAAEQRAAQLGRAVPGGIYGVGGSAKYL